MITYFHKGLKQFHPMLEQVEIYQDNQVIFKGLYQDFLYQERHKTSHDLKSHCIIWNGINTQPIYHKITIK